jgi:hypothetical protein
MRYPAIMRVARESRGCEHSTIVMATYTIVQSRHSCDHHFNWGIRRLKMRQKWLTLSAGLLSRLSIG